MVEKIKVGDRFKTNSYGEVVVIDYIHCNNIIIQFEDGNTRSVSSGNLRAGKVNNKKAPPKGKSKLGDIVIGETRPSKNFGDFKVIEFISTTKITIEFCATGTKQQVSSQQIREGSVFDPYAKTKFGVGFFGQGKYNSKDNKKEYITWTSMLSRAYSKAYKEMYPTYENVTVCENWLCFQNFAMWCNSQENFNKDSWVLEKDILLKGNKHYCPEYCRFVPHPVNSLIVKCDASRGNLPIGVSWCTTKKKFAAHVNRDGKTVFCGYHYSPTSAFLAYKAEKEKIIKEVVNRYKDCIDVDIYKALINYEVSIDD